MSPDTEKALLALLERIASALEDLPSAIDPEHWTGPSVEKADRIIANITDRPPAPDADGWIEWHGGECPVPADTLVNVQLGTGFKPIPTRANIWNWRVKTGNTRIAAYRIAA